VLRHRKKQLVVSPFLAVLRNALMTFAFIIIVLLGSIIECRLLIFLPPTAFLLIKYCLWFEGYLFILN